MEFFDEDELAVMMRAALAKLGPLHPHERLNMPPMIRGQDIEVPLFTLNETVTFHKKNTLS